MPASRRLMQQEKQGEMIFGGFAREVLEGPNSLPVLLAHLSAKKDADFMSAMIVRLACLADATGANSLHLKRFVIGDALSVVIAQP